MSYEPLHHKYRPQRFAELVGQEVVATTLTNAIKTCRISPAYLFSGPRGTGKTSCARILAKSLNCLVSNYPTAEPCGKCDVCIGITKNYALDVTEIDAASNTGVDNIREVIERAQFAPVQCRYKVYIIDECLTGDSLISTAEGLVRIDNPKIKGTKVLSYNETTGNWEYKTVIRHLERGTKSTLIVKTNNREIRCTLNHLIRSETGWIQAKDLKAGMRIISPILNSNIETSHANLPHIKVPEDLLKNKDCKAVPLNKNYAIRYLPWNKQEYYRYSSIFMHMEKDLLLQSLYVKEPIVKSIYARKNKVCRKSLYPVANCYIYKLWESFAKSYWETVPVFDPKNINWNGQTGKKRMGIWNIRHKYPLFFNRRSKLQIIKNIGVNQSYLTCSAILKSRQFLRILNQINIGKPYKDGSSTKIIQKVNSLQINSQHLITRFKQNPEQKIKLVKSPVINGGRQLEVEDNHVICNNILSLTWATNLETVQSVHFAGIEKVYDIEVEDNHNFVANGLLVHNCHMLSTPAFNALLKTLEEPPQNVVFILATTHPQRVLPTIISRCQRFDFRRIPLPNMAYYLRNIAGWENINISREAINLVAQIAQGSLRDAESLLDQLSLLSEQVTPERVLDLVGSVGERDLINLLNAIITDNAEAVLDTIRQILDTGREPLVILQNLLAFYRDLLIAQAAPDRHDLVAYTQETWELLINISQKLDVNEILQGQQYLRTAEVQIKNTFQPHLWLEVILLGLLPSAHKDLQENDLNAYQTEKKARKDSSAIQDNKYDASIIQQRHVSNPKNALPINTDNSTYIHPVLTTPPNSQLDKDITLQELQTTPNQQNTLANPKNNDFPIQTNPQVTVHQLPDESLLAIWKQVLANMPKPTQALLRQHGHLLSIDQEKAVVGVTPKLVKLTQGKLADLEKAFSQVYQGEQKVKLVSQKSQYIWMKEKSEITKNSSSFSPISVNINKLQPGFPKSEIPTTNQSVVKSQQTIAAKTKTSNINSNGDGNKLSLNKTNDVLLKSNSQAYFKTSNNCEQKKNWDAYELGVAAQRLANFFGGQVVSFTDELNQLTKTLTELEIIEDITDNNNISLD